MDLTMLKALSSHLPRLNEAVVGGFSKYETSKNLEPYIDTVLRTCAAESYPKQLKYLGMEVCDPYTRFQQTVGKKPYKPVELSKTTVNMFKLLYSLNGTPINVYLLFPYLKDGDRLYINGARYKVTPILSASLFNIEHNKIFMASGSRKSVTSFQSVDYGVSRNGNVRISNCIYSYLYIMRDTERAKGIYPPLIHYILSKYGLSDTLKFMGLNGVVITKGDEVYDFKHFYVYKSNGVCPIKSTKRFWQEPKLRIVIPREENTTMLNRTHLPIVDGIMCSIFHIVDGVSFYDDVNIDYEDKNYWISSMTKFLFKNPTHTQLEADHIERHVNWVERLIDPLTLTLFNSDNVDCKDIYDVFKYMIFNYNDMISHNNVGDVLGKELSVTKYLMLKVTSAIFKTVYALEKLPPDFLTVKKVEDIFNTNLRPNVFTKVDTRKGELSSEAIPIDCLPFKATCNVISHAKASGLGNDSINYTDPFYQYEPSKSVVMSRSCITKTAPSGDSKLNPFITLTPSGRTIADSQSAVIINQMRKLAKGTAR